MTQEEGLYKVTIQAKRSEGVYPENPKMELWVNNQMRMRWIVENTDEYAPYTWKGYWDESSTINVVLVNGDGTYGSVADLVVDCIKVNNQTVQAESANAVFYETSDFANPVGTPIPATEIVSEKGVLAFTVTGATALTRLFGYDYNNMVTSINENGTVSTYTYNPAGQRVKKVEDGTATYYFYANYQLEKTATTETQVVYYYINGEQIAQRTITETSEQLLYVHKDHLGSAVRLTDEAGNVVQSIAYEPYGTTVYSHGNNEPDRQFTGQIKDGTGLYFYNARYYNPTLGRFITADTVLDGLNRYTYCGNNPVRYSDPTGNDYSWDPSSDSAVEGYVEDWNYVPDPWNSNDTETNNAALRNSGELGGKSGNSATTATASDFKAPSAMFDHDEGPTPPTEPTVEQQAVIKSDPPRYVQYESENDGARGSESISGNRWPVDSGNLSCASGDHWWDDGSYRKHGGIDISIPEGTPVHPRMGGVVMEKFWAPGKDGYFPKDKGDYGNLLLILHDDGTITAYAHLKDIIVGKGQRVEKDTVVALSGETGWSTGPHLHFEVRLDGVGKDPIDYLGRVPASFTIDKDIYWTGVTYANRKK